MADNFIDFTGLLEVEKATPVIMALFKGYHIEQHSKLNSAGGFNTTTYYIGKWDTYNYGDGESWESLLDRLLDMYPSQVVKDAELDDSDYYANVLLHVAKQFNAEQHPVILRIIEGFKSYSMYYDQIEPQDIFELAKVFDDGHGINHYYLMGSYTCTKPRLDDFGGFYEFHSDRLHFSSDTYTYKQTVPHIDGALKENATHLAAGSIAGLVHKTYLSGIADEQQRQAVGWSLANLLLESFPANTVTTVAVNEPTFQHYYAVTAVNLFD